MCLYKIEYCLAITNDDIALLIKDVHVREKQHHEFHYFIKISPVNSWHLIFLFHPFHIKMITLVIYALAYLI